ncbi:MAG: hypothetical protein OXF02_05590 [Simkaniaceae bacterium]|nr:hypothetical protein [Simkaniaceae bacterium]
MKNVLDKVGNGKAQSPLRECLAMISRKIVFVRIAGLLIPSLFLFAGTEKHKEHGKQTYYYDTSREGQTAKTTTTWTVKNEKGLLRLHGKDGKGETNVTVSPGPDTESFSYRETKSGSGYAIERDRTYVSVKKTDNGQTVEKRLYVGSTPWIQEFDFSLRPFILSSSPAFKFYIVHPEKLSLHHLVATKSSTSVPVRIGGKEYKAIPVTISLSGLKKFFWKADLMFEKTTGDLLTYRANDGPGTPVVTTVFSGKKPKG